MTLCWSNQPDRLHISKHLCCCAPSCSQFIVSWLVSPAGSVARPAGWPTGRLARTGRAVCLCCVVFCLPPRLWVTIHTLLRVQIQGTVPVSASSLAWLWFTAGCLLLGRLHVFMFWTRSFSKVTCGALLLLCYSLTSCWFSTYTTATAMYLFLKELPLHVLWVIRGKKGQHFSSDKGTDCLFTKRSQEAIRQKIALENCSFWVTEQYARFPATYAPASEWASTRMGKWPTEWMALWLMVTR